MVRLRKLAWIPIVLALASASVVTAQEPVVVVSFKNVDALVSDLKYVFGTGSPDLAASVDGWIMDFTKGQGLVGVDKKKPLGATMAMSKAGSPEVVLFLPVSDGAAFKNMLKKAVTGFKDTSTGFNFSIGENKWYGKIVGGHCYLSLQADALGRAPDAAKFATAKHSLTLDAQLSKMTNDTKDGIIEQLEAALGGGEPEQPKAVKDRLGKLPPGADLGQKSGVDLVKMFVKQSQRLSIGLDVDIATKTVTVDFDAVPVPGSNLGQAMAAYPKTKSQFAALASDDDAASFLFATPLAKGTQDIVAAGIKEVTKRLDERIDHSEKIQRKPAVHDLVAKIAKIINVTTDSGTADGVLVLSSLDDGKARIIAASKVSSGADVQKAIDEFAAAIGDGGSARVQFDVAKHGDARIHSISIDIESEWKKRLGGGPSHIAVTDKSVVFAAGPDSLAALLAALDKIGQPGGDRPPVSFRIRPSKLIELLGAGDDENLKLAREAFNGEGDLISIDLLATDAGKGSRLRMVLGEGFQRYVSKSLDQFINAEPVEEKR